MIATPQFRAQALGCAAMGLLCQWVGLLHGETRAPAFTWPGMPICHTGGIDWRAGFGDGLSMGLVMVLVSLAPRRWSGVFSLAKAATALLWVVGTGVLQALILVVDQIAPAAGGGVPSALPRLLVLALGMGAALAAAHRPGGKVERPALRDGAQCFRRCGPMMIAMMLTGAMSLPWVIAGALVTQIDEAIGDRRLSHLLTWGIGAAAAAIIAAPA